MTLRATVWANEIDGLETLDKLVLIGLVERAAYSSDSEELATASLGEIARFACCGVRDVNAALDRLTAFGLIVPKGLDCWALRVGRAPREVAP